MESGRSAVIAFRLRAHPYRRILITIQISHIINHIYNHHTIMKLKSLALAALFGTFLQHQSAAQETSGGGTSGGGGTAGAGAGGGSGGASAQGGGAAGGAGADTGGGQTQPGQTQPGQAQPGQTQPGQTQPGQAQPGQAQPGQTQPGQTQPGQTQPGQAQPGQTQPGQTQPNFDQTGVGDASVGGAGTGAPGTRMERDEEDEEYTLVEPGTGQSPQASRQGPAARGGAPTASAGESAAEAVGWDGSNHRQMKLDEIDAKVRAAFQNASNHSEIDPGITRIDYHGREVFRAREILPDSERYLYVDRLGDLVKIQEPIALESAPQRVRTTADQQQRGATGSALMRETQGNTTHYILRVTREGQPLRWVQMDDAGNILKSVTQEDLSSPPEENPERGSLRNSNRDSN
jgi:hypothetical protein